MGERGERLSTNDESEELKVLTQSEHETRKSHDTTLIGRSNISVVGPEFYFGSC